MPNSRLRASEYFNRPVVENIVSRNIERLSFFYEMRRDSREMYEIFNQESNRRRQERLEEIMTSYDSDTDDETDDEYDPNENPPEIYEEPTYYEEIG